MTPLPPSFLPAAAVSLGSPPPQGATPASRGHASTDAGADSLIAGLTDAQRVSKEVRRQYRLLARAKHQKAERRRLWRLMAGEASTLDYAGFVQFMLRTLDPQGTLKLRAADVARAHGAIFPHLAASPGPASEVALRNAPSPTAGVEGGCGDGEGAGQEGERGDGFAKAEEEEEEDVRVVGEDGVELEFAQGAQARRLGASQGSGAEQTPGARRQGPHQHPHRHQVAREFARISMDRLAAPVLHATSARRQNYRKMHVSARLGAGEEETEARVRSEAARVLGLSQEQEGACSAARGRSSGSLAYEEAEGAGGEAGRGERGRHRRERGTSASPDSQRVWHRDASGRVVLSHADANIRGANQPHSRGLRRADTFLVSGAALRAGEAGEEADAAAEEGAANTASASRRARARFARLRHAVHRGNLVSRIRRAGEAWGAGDADVAASVDARTGRVLDSSALALSYQAREADGCTFRPRINEASRRMASKRRVRADATGEGRPGRSVHDELLAKHRAAERELERVRLRALCPPRVPCALLLPLRLPLNPLPNSFGCDVRALPQLRKSAEEAELERCTFSPQVTSLPPYLQRKIARMRGGGQAGGDDAGVGAHDGAPATPSKASLDGSSPQAATAGSGGRKENPYDQSPPTRVFEKLYQASKVRWGCRCLRAAWGHELTTPACYTRRTASPLAPRIGHLAPAGVARRARSNWSWRSTAPSSQRGTSSGQREGAPASPPQAPSPRPPRARVGAAAARTPT